MRRRLIDGNTVVQSFTVTGKHTGKHPASETPPTGKEVILEGCAFYYIKNEKIVKFKEFSNYLGFFQQVGLLPPIG